MRFRMAENISLEEICGTYLLIASGEALSRLDYVRVVNEVGAEIITMIMENMDTGMILQRIAQRYEMKEENIRPGICRFIDELTEKGYLILEKGEQL